MRTALYNNVGICALGIAFTVEYSRCVVLANALLIAPIVAHAELTSYLARKTTQASSVEQLLTKKATWFSNFNARYFDGLTQSVNAIQLLCELGVVEIQDGRLMVRKALKYDASMGKRARVVSLASLRIADLLRDEPANLYSTLRVQL